MKLTALIACLGFSSFVSGSRISLRGQQHLGLEMDNFLKTMYGDVTDCSEGMSGLCSQAALKDKEVSCKDFKPAEKDEDGIVLPDSSMDLPDSLRGIWWLTDQGTSSSIMSFAQTRDGTSSRSGPIGVYERDPDKTDCWWWWCTPVKNYGEIAVRVAGDRTWSFAVGVEDNFELVKNLDLVYHFQCWCEDDSELEECGSNGVEVNFCQIHPQALNYAGFKLGSYGEWLMDFEMEYVKNNRDYDYWLRKSYAFGKEISSKRYELIRIYEEDGAPTTQHEDWVRNCGEEETGGNGNIYYRSAL